jgi:hypoxanthine phosphoribosyltransferase
MLKIENKLILSWEDIKEVIEKLSTQILNLDRRPFYLYGVPRGGLIPATWLSHKTGITYYQINAAQISKLADLSHILIIDDICDTGKTIEKLKENYPKCKTATLYCKENSPIKPDYYGELIKDEWLVFPWESEEKVGQRDKTFDYE